MSSTKRDVNAYSPEGRIYQIEYAMKAMNLGTTTLGLTTPTSSILVSEKKIINSLQLSSTRKHFKIYDHAALGFSGISGDSKTILTKAREYCLQHAQLYDEKVPVEGMLKHLSTLALKFGEKDSSRKIFGRPFGASVIVAGYDTQPRLYAFDPSGSYRECRAKAIGSAHEAVEADVQEWVLGEGDAVGRALGSLGRVMKDRISCENVEVCVVDKEGVRFLSKEEISQKL